MWGNARLTLHYRRGSKSRNYGKELFSSLKERKVTTGKLGEKLKKY